MMKFSLDKDSKYSGFTLLEMLIVASIVIILSVIVVTNYEFGGYKHNVQRSAHKLAQDLRRAEEMAMSAREFEGEVPLGGYGIYFNWQRTSPPAVLPPDRTRYVLFADKNNNADFDPLNEEIETILLEDNVEINQVCSDTLCIDDTAFIFLPPDPIVKIGTDETALYAYFELRSTKVEGIIKVWINNAGLIEIQPAE